MYEIFLMENGLKSETDTFLNFLGCKVFIYLYMFKLEL